MNKTLSILFLALLIATLAAHPATNGWEQMRLQGRVESITTTSGMDECIYRETISFDEEGKFSHIFIRDIDLVFAEGDCVYEYNEAGQIVSITKPDNEGEQIETFLYDAEGILFLSSKLSSGAGIEFLDRSYWNLEGKIELNTIHEWNELVWVESYSYGDSGRVCQTLRPASHYSRLGYSSYVYDEFDNATLIREWELQNEICIQTRYEYSYDPWGNILSSNKFIDYDDGEGEVLEEIKSCEYVYFEN